MHFGYLSTMCCFMLGAAFAMPSYDETPLLERSAETADMEMGKEIVGKNMLGADEDVTPPGYTVTTEHNPTSDEMTTKPRYDQTTSFDHLLKRLPEVQGLGLEEYMIYFARTELSAFLEVIPKSSSRFLLSESNPCKMCTQKYFPCKEFCLELLTRSTDHILNSFICIVICWQDIINCCIISRQTKAQLESIN